MYKKNIALVFPQLSGGVKTILTKLYQGLKSEGFYVTSIPLQGNNIPFIMYKDLTYINRLREFDVVLFLGSIPWPSHIFIKDAVVGLFLNGFIRYELLNLIKHARPRTGLGAMFLLSYWDAIRNLNKFLNKIDFFICHSITACEANDIHGRYILLPQFVLLEEVKLFNKLTSDMNKYSTQKGNRVTIITYTSFAESPRLLKDIHIILLMRKVSKQVRKNIELIMVDPRRSGESVKHMGNLIVRYRGFVPKKLFLKLLMDSDLYIECCIDEELRYSAIESGLVRTPVAKITYHRYIDRQDYDENDIILAKRPEEFVRKVTEYISHIEYYKDYYSRRINDFIITRRTWNYVKKNLINRII